MFSAEVDVSQLDLDVMEIENPFEEFENDNDFISKRRDKSIEEPPQEMNTNNTVLQATTTSQKPEQMNKIESSIDSIPKPQLTDSSSNVIDINTNNINIPHVPSPTRPNVQSNSSSNIVVQKKIQKAEQGNDWDMIVGEVNSPMKLSNNNDLGFFTTEKEFSENRTTEGKVQLSELGNIIVHSGWMNQKIKFSVSEDNIYDDVFSYVWNSSQVFWYRNQKYIMKRIRGGGFASHYVVTVEPINDELRKVVQSRVMQFVKRCSGGERIGSMISGDPNTWNFVRLGKRVCRFRANGILQKLEEEQKLKQLTE